MMIDVLRCLNLKIVIVYVLFVLEERKGWEGYMDETRKELYAGQMRIMEDKRCVVMSES